MISGAAVFAGYVTGPSTERSWVAAETWSTTAG